MVGEDAAVLTRVDVTDLVEFLQRQESVSGVQRVIAETAPRMLDLSTRAIVLDRGRGVFVDLTADEVNSLLTRRTSIDRAGAAAAATACLERARSADPSLIDSATTVVFLGAVWISDALMLAARAVHAAGARCVYLLYDLTPVLQAGHTAAVNRLFERYLALITQTGSRVPAISASSRADYVAHCEQSALTAPPGAVTRLPNGLSPDRVEGSDPPWPRPFALFVGTIEARKNHLLALHAWRTLVERHGADRVPDLVCIGRLGWHSSAFLDEYVRSAGLGGKLSVLSTSVSDADLARFYAHCEFTVYPSAYEGWGLPVSESLAFGKLPIVADNSSLREAGRDLAVYFRSGEVDALVAAIESQALDAAARREHERQIAADGTEPVTWAQVAGVMMSEVAQANSAEARSPVFPAVELGREYTLAVGQPAPDSGYADQYLAHLQDEGLTPMLRQPRGDRDFEVVDAALVGTLGSPQTWGTELRPGRRLDVRIRRPVDGPLNVLLSTRSMPGVATIEAAGPGGPLREEVYLGSVITLHLGSGRAGEPAQVSLTVVDAQDSIEGFLGLRSFVVLREDDLTSEVLAHKSAAAALRAELDFVTNTRSWKVTAPLRRFKGRGAG